MNERELIQNLMRDLPSNEQVVVGAGDDCAVVDLGLASDWVLFKIDATIEGVHFTSDAAPEAVGHKALGRCLSDVAAMAGTPSCAVIALGLPHSFDPAYVQAIYQGMRRLADRYHVALVGGETSLSPERITLTVSLIGTVSKDRCVRRTGAQPGDALFVTGELGGSILGKHLSFEPRLAQANWLRAHYDIHAMIDVSDGLATDLRHLMEASGLGAELLAKNIPVSQAARRKAKGNAGAALQAALNDGEDFELLFAVKATDCVTLKDAWAQAFPELNLRCIGKMISDPGLKLRTQDTLREWTQHGYDHFA
jgi:thiamine-monophosphate kinase